MPFQILHEYTIVGNTYIESYDAAIFIGQND